MFLIVAYLSFYTFSLETNQQVVEKVWSEGREHSCTQEMKRAFSDSSKSKLLSKIKSSNDRAQLTKALNAFLSSLNLSHTEFYDSTSEGFQFFRSHVRVANNSKNPLPKYPNPGIQFSSGEQRNRVRAVFEKSEAFRAGLRPGDIIIESDGQSFPGYWRSVGLKSLRYRRGHKTHSIKLKVENMNLSQALFEAQKNSVALFDYKGVKMAYLHLWTGTHPKSAIHLQQVAAQMSDKADGFILDLRDGYGGAWWDHLDAFYKNRRNYFKAQVKDIDGKLSYLKPEPKKNKKAFTKPLVVLINNSVRSGKEALAYQFKKTKRAKLVGSKTPGYFSLGRFSFAEQDLDYVLYLCTRTITLDGQQIEGIGIRPDIEVSGSNNADGKDSQFIQAQKQLYKLIKS